MITDNGKELNVAAGDVLITYSGEHHGLKNTGKGPLKFLAFICGT